MPATQEKSILQNISEILETSNEGFWLVDNGEVTVHVNPKMCIILGRAKHDIIGKSIFEFVDETNKAIFVREGTFRAKGKKSSYEITLTQKDGKQIPCMVHASPYYDNAGKKVGSFAMVTDISEQKAIERALKESELRYRTLFESSNDAIFLLKGDKFTDYNHRTLEIFGCTNKIIQKSGFKNFYPQLQPSGRSSKAVLASKIDEAKAGRDQYFEWQYVRRDGSYFYAETYIKSIQIQDENYLFVVIRDTTEKKTLEMQLQQAQKMEAIGRLAGGVAHDFNNLLTVIRGYSDLILTRLDQTEAIFHRVKQIDLACERAEGLTHQLLAFSRHQILKIKKVNINDQISEMGIMLKRMIGEHIELISKLESKPLYIKADPSQMEQVIMNLVINARDAMPDGGKLILETKCLTIDHNFKKKHPEAKRGTYAMLAITDNGAGIDKETLTHIFEPFFTTKQEGEGTGLGLAMVYGIVKQSDGFVAVSSEPGKGSSFRIYLPLVAGELRDKPKKSLAAKDLCGHETILLVEDESDVRMLVKETLEMMNYNVLEAADGIEALEISSQNKRGIELVLTDVVMPRMGGKELVDQLLKKRPEIKTIFMSGYTENAIVNKGVLAPNTQFLQKPFSPNSLTQKVREVLDQK